MNKSGSLAIVSVVQNAHESIAQGEVSKVLLEAFIHGLDVTLDRLDNVWFLEEEEEEEEEEESQTRQTLVQEIGMPAYQEVPLFDHTSFGDHSHMGLNSRETEHEPLACCAGDR